MNIANALPIGSPNSHFPMKSFRTEIRQYRAILSPYECRQSAKRVAQRLRKQIGFRRAKSIAGYWPIAGELDTRPIFTVARDLKKRIYLPVISRFFGKKLCFSPYTPGQSTYINRLGIPEPFCPRRVQRSAIALDLILIPLLAFDTQGGRIGMGGGFYDQTLQYRHRRKRRRPQLVGLGYEWQRCTSSLPLKPWDVRLDAMITEHHRYLAIR